MGALEQRASLGGVEGRDAAGKGLVHDLLERVDKEADYDPLTPRELEVLKPIAEGKTSKEIAELPVLSIKAVERHRADILRRLSMRDRVDLTRYAVRRGLVEP